MSDRGEIEDSESFVPNGAILKLMASSCDFRWCGRCKRELPNAEFYHTEKCFVCSSCLKKDRRLSNKRSYDLKMQDPEGRKLQRAIWREGYYRRNGLAFPISDPDFDYLQNARKQRKYARNPENKRKIRARSSDRSRKLLIAVKILEAMGMVWKNGEWRDQANVERCLSASRTDGAAQDSASQRSYVSPVTPIGCAEMGFKEQEAETGLQPRP